MSASNLLPSLRLALLIWAAWPAWPTQAQSAYPVRAIHYIVPYAPGSGNDTLARRMAQLLSDSFKQSVVVENNAGAGGIIGTAQVARGASDGYLIGMGST